MNQGGQRSVFSYHYSIPILGTSTIHLRIPTNSQFSFSFLSQGVSSNGLKGLFDIDGLLRRSFEIGNVSFGLTPSHGTFLRDLRTKKREKESIRCLQQLIQQMKTSFLS